MLPVIFSLLLPLVAGIEFEQLSLDKVTGHLMKPPDWSNEKFMTVKYLRMAVSIVNMVELFSS